MTNPWRPPTLDPNLTMLVMQAKARPEGHWLHVQAMQRRAWWRGLWWDAILTAAVALAGFALWSLILAALA